MIYNKSKLEKIQSLYADFCSDKKCKFELFDAIGNFLTETYEGPYVCNLKENFPELHEIVSNLAKVSNSADVERFLLTNIKVKMLPTHTHLMKLPEIRNHLRAQKSSKIMVENNLSLFNAISCLKELMLFLPSSPTSENELIARFQTGQSFTKMNTKEPFPTRRNVMLQVLNSNPNNLKKEFSHASYKKLVQIASKEKLSPSEFVTTVKQEYKHKNNILPHFFETGVVKQFVKKSINVETYRDAISNALDISPQKMLSLLGEKQSTAQQPTSTESIYQKLQKHTFCHLDYFPTQTKLASNHFLLELNVFYNKSFKNLAQTMHSSDLVKKHVQGLQPLTGVDPQAITKKYPKESFCQIQTPQPQVKKQPKKKFLDASKKTQYFKGTMEELEQIIKAELKSAFPSGKVRSLTTKHPEIWSRIRALLNKLKKQNPLIKTEDLLTSWGYEIEETRGCTSAAYYNNERVGFLKKEIETIATPEKIVYSSVLWHPNNSTIVRKLHRYAASQNKDKATVLSELGFIYVNNRPNSNSDDQDER